MIHNNMTPKMSRHIPNLVEEPDETPEWGNILCYVVDIFFIHHDPFDVFNEIHGLILESGSVHRVKMYLNTKLKLL